MGFHVCSDGEVLCASRCRYDAGLHTAAGIFRLKQLRFAELQDFLFCVMKNFTEKKKNNREGTPCSLNAAGSSAVGDHKFSSPSNLLWLTIDLAC